MPSKKFYIFAVILISTALLFSSSLLDRKFSKLNSTQGKASVVEVVYPEEGKIISFEPSRPIEQNPQNLNIIQEDQNTKDITPLAEKKDEDPPKKKVIPFSCLTSEKEYDDMWLFNLGQNISLPDTTYIPKGLEKIPNIYSARTNICLTHDTLENLEAMLSQAKIDGHIIKVTSAFRTFDYQTGLLQTATDNGNSDANLSIAKPGYSEHQLGTTVDLSGESINFSSADRAFNYTEEAKWLEEHASDYGFIESYPKDKTDITGYIYEPWHYRYVGIDNAKQILKNNQTITEFLNK